MIWKVHTGKAVSMYRDIDIKKITHFYYVEPNRKWKRPNFHPRIFDGMVFFTEGAIEYIFEEKSIVAKKGSLLLLPGNIPYKGRPLTDRIAYYVLNFESEDPEAFRNFMAPAVMTVSDYEAEALRFACALEVWNKQLIDVYLKTRIFAYEVLCRALEITEGNQSAVSTDEIIAYITRNLSDESLNILKLCEKFYISQSQLRRNIFRVTHMNPNEYIMTLRLNKAKKELIYTDKPVKQIAGECGFSSPYYFSNCFSKKFHMSPVKFREAHGDTKIY